MIRFEFDKETKGSIRYKEVSDSPVVGTLYIRKDKLENLQVSGKKPIVIEIKEVTE